MKINYFDDTDTLLIVFSKHSVVATEDVNEQMIVDLDESGNPVTITIEHAHTFVDVNSFSFQHIKTGNRQTAIVEPA